MFVEVALDNTALKRHLSLSSPFSFNYFVLSEIPFSLDHNLFTGTGMNVCGGIKKWNTNLNTRRKTMCLSIAILQYSSLQGVIYFVVFLKSAFSVFHGCVRQGLNFKGILIY